MDIDTVTFVGRGAVVAYDAVIDDLRVHSTGNAHDRGVIKVGGACNPVVVYPDRRRERDPDAEGIGLRAGLTVDTRVDDIIARDHKGTVRGAPDTDRTGALDRVALDITVRQGTGIEMYGSSASPRRRQ